MKFFSIFLILWMLIGISRPNDECNTYANPAPSDTEIDIEE